MNACAQNQIDCSFLYFFTCQTTVENINKPRKREENGQNNKFLVAVYFAIEFRELLNERRKIIKLGWWYIVNLYLMRIEITYFHFVYFQSVRWDNAMGAINNVVFCSISSLAFSLFVIWRHRLINFVAIHFLSSIWLLLSSHFTFNSIEDTNEKYLWLRHCLFVSTSLRFVDNRNSK